MFRQTNRPRMNPVLIALGTNIGDRVGHIRRAISALRATPGITRLTTAPWFETDPVGMTDANINPFINTAVTVETSQEPTAVLALLQSIETSMGQAITKNNTARIIDLDIIGYGSRVINHPHLTIPHPRFRTRRFVLEPLVFIAPDWIDPVSGQSIRALFESLSP